MGDLLDIAHAAPQIAIALAIVSAALLVAKMVIRMSRGPVSKSKPKKLSMDDKLDSLLAQKGTPACNVQTEHCQDRFDLIEKRQTKVYGALLGIRKTQDDVLEFLTNGSQRPEVPQLAHNIDDEPTGDHF